MFVSPANQDRCPIDPGLPKNLTGMADGAFLEGLPQPLQAWFAYGLSGSARGDFIRFLEEPVDGAVREHVLSANRNLGSTASLVMAARRELARTPEGWRFLPPEEADKALDTWPWGLDPIRAEITETARVAWSPSETDSAHRLFRRKPGPGYGKAMAAALNALLQAMPLS